MNENLTFDLDFLDSLFKNDIPFENAVGMVHRAQVCAKGTPMGKTGAKMQVMPNGT